MSKKSDDHVVGSIEFKKNGSINVIYHNVNEEDSELFELAYEYVIYCLNRMDWMEEFVQIEEKQEQKKEDKGSHLRLIKNENS